MLDDSEGYTETHLIQVVAFDAAGNEVESEPVRVFVIHKEEEEEEEQEQGAVLPREDWIALPVDDRRLVAVG
jgi:hypothetical protein